MYFSVVLCCSNSLCEDCVRAEYRAIKLRTKLQNDVKVINELLKDKATDATG